MQDDRALIRSLLELRSSHGRPDLSFWLAPPSSSIEDLGELCRRSNFQHWAYERAIEGALAKHLLKAPDLVKGRCVLDFTFGGGLAGSAAARAGATQVYALEVNSLQSAAIGLNAEANGVKVEMWGSDAQTPRGCSIVLAGDILGDSDLAAALMAIFERYRLQGIEVLLAEPSEHAVEAYDDRLEPLGAENCMDFDVFSDGRLTPTGVFRLR